MISTTPMMTTTLKTTTTVPTTTLVTTTIPTTTLSTLRTNLMERTSQPFTTPVNSPNVSSTFYNPNTKTTTKKEKPSSILGIYPKIYHTIEEKTSTYNASVLSTLFILESLIFFNEHSLFFDVHIRHPFWFLILIDLMVFKAISAIFQSFNSQRVLINL